MNWLLRIMKLSCRRATELVEKGILFKLSRVEKYRLSLHMKICKACRNYDEQAHLLHQVLEKSAGCSTHVTPESNESISMLKTHLLENLDLES